MNDNKLTQMLLHFRNSSLLPEIDSDTERKIFRELQRYDLLILNSQGAWVITRKGEEALKTGVKKYIHAEKLEAQLARQAPNLKKQKNLLLVLSLILIGLLVLILLESPDLLEVL